MAADRTSAAVLTEVGTGRPARSPSPRSGTLEKTLIIPRLAQSLSLVGPAAPHRVAEQQATLCVSPWPSLAFTRNGQEGRCGGRHFLEHRLALTLKNVETTPALRPSDLLTPGGSDQAPRGQTARRWLQHHIDPVANEAWGQMALERKAAWAGALTPALPTV